MLGVDDAWLDAASASDLQALADALADGRVSPDFSTAAVQLAGLPAGAARFLAGLRGTDPVVVAWMLRRIARERGAAAQGASRVASLVWSGASEGEEPTRDTRTVLDGLFRRARSHVLIASYVIYDGSTVFAALLDQARANPGLQIELYVNLPSETGVDDDEHWDAARYLTTFARHHWAPDVALPALFYDPETRRLGAKRAALHAKCVVVDRRWAFVTSANFTEAAQERNIEAGILLDHPRIAEALIARFHGLRASGRLRAMRR